MRSPLQAARDDADHFRRLIPSSKAARDVLGERARQIEVEGWTAEHDDQHLDGSIATAAACYADPNPTLETRHFEGYDGAYRGSDVPRAWPRSWAPNWWKPKDRRRDLVRSGALILAEIERLDRAAVTTPPAETGG